MSLKIVSYNLRCVWSKGDGVNCFIHRGGMILDKIEREQPDVLCFQECVPSHADFLRKHLNGYTFIFNQRNADYSGEGLALAIKNGVIELYGLDVFWLSNTPRVPGSRFEIQSKCPRICQYAVLRDLRTGVLFRTFNVHLDHVSDEARILGIKQLLDYAAQRNLETAMPLFIMGDFNALPDSETIRYCDSFEDLKIVDLTSQTGGTWHNFGKPAQNAERILPEKIDYIYCDAATAQKPNTVTLWEDELNGIYLSDHYPVSLDIEI